MRLVSSYNGQSWEPCPRVCLIESQLIYFLGVNRRISGAHPTLFSRLSSAVCASPAPKWWLLRRLNARRNAFFQFSKNQTKAIGIFAKPFLISSGTRLSRDSLWALTVILNENLERRFASLVHFVNIGSESKIEHLVFYSFTYPCLIRFSAISKRFCWIAVWMIGPRSMFSPLLICCFKSLQSSKLSVKISIFGQKVRFLSVLVCLVR